MSVCDSNHRQSTQILYFGTVWCRNGRMMISAMLGVNPSRSRFRPTGTGRSRGSRGSAAWVRGVRPLLAWSCGSLGKGRGTGLREDGRPALNAHDSRSTGRCQCGPRSCGGNRRSSPCDGRRGRSSLAATGPRPPCGAGFRRSRTRGSVTGPQLPQRSASALVFLIAGKGCQMIHFCARLRALPPATRPLVGLRHRLVRGFSAQPEASSRRPARRGLDGSATSRAVKPHGA